MEGMLGTAYQQSYGRMDLGRCIFSAEKHLSNPGRSLTAHQGRGVRFGTYWHIPHAGVDQQGQQNLLAKWSHGRCAQ